MLSRTLTLSKRAGIFQLPAMATAFILHEMHPIQQIIHTTNFVPRMSRVGATCTWHVLSVDGIRKGRRV